MEIKATPKEIAALVAALQERRVVENISSPVEVVRQVVQKSIDGIALDK